jgi:hypothetical protein
MRYEGVLDWDGDDDGGQWVVWGRDKRNRRRVEVSIDGLLSDLDGKSVVVKEIEGGFSVRVKDE